MSSQIFCQVKEMGFLGDLAFVHFPCCPFSNVKGSIIYFLQWGIKRKLQHCYVDRRKKDLVLQIRWVGIHLYPLCLVLAEVVFQHVLEWGMQAVLGSMWEVEDKGADCEKTTWSIKGTNLQLVLFVVSLTVAEEQEAFDQRAAFNDHCKKVNAARSVCTVTVQLF